MAAWFVPAVKAILPYVSSIVAAALPVFSTRKSDEAAAAQAQVLQQQIAELKSAASQNAVHPKCFTLGLGRLAKFSHGKMLSPFSF